MIQRLKKLQNLFKCCKSKEQINIPNIIAYNEKIIRSIFSPINLSKDQKKIKANAFKPPADLDEISVNRLDFTTLDFCRSLCKKIEIPDLDRNYFGLALLYVFEIKECGAEIIYSPKEDNIFHADIKIGFKVKKGEQLPAEIQYIVDGLTKKAKLFKDENPTSEKWTGIELE